MRKPVRPDQHGTTTGYTYGCRCERCAQAIRDYVNARAWKRGVRRRDPKPALVAAWKFATANGTAGRFADRIVQSRDVPDRLLAALGLTTSSESEAA